MPVITNLTNQNHFDRHSSKLLLKAFSSRSVVGQFRNFWGIDSHRGSGNVRTFPVSIGHTIIRHVAARISVTHTRTSAHTQVISGDSGFGIVAYRNWEIVTFNPMSKPPSGKLFKLLQLLYNCSHTYFITLAVLIISLQSQPDSSVSSDNHWKLVSLRVIGHRCYQLYYQNNSR